MDMENNEKVTPVLPGGFRDYLQEEAIARDRIINAVKTIYERFGFLPLETSPIEYLGVLSGQGEISKQIYKVYNQSPEAGEKSLALRFDLTVPLSRVVAANFHQLTFPFKRYQMGYVWRGERQQKGRFKQFLQFDVDIVGSDSPIADAEIITIMAETMTTLGIKQYKIHYNHRQILNSLAERIGITDEASKLELFRLIDKIPSAGWDKIKQTMADETSVLKLSNENIDIVDKYIHISGSREEKINQLKQILPPGAEKHLEEIKSITDLVRSEGIQFDTLEFDQTIARGLDYYTGMVFETTITQAPQLGSVMGGGRYDRLVARFLNRTIPSVGVSLGVDRLIVGLETLGILNVTPSLTQVLITNLIPEKERDMVALGAKLRGEGVKTEVFLGREDMRTQLGYANKKGIPVVIIVGQEELEKGVFSVKNMRNRDQTQHDEKNLISFVKDILINIQ